MTSAPTILCSGAATMDTIFRMAALPREPGKYLPIEAVEVAHGMASSAAAAIARLGGRSLLFARVGADETGTRFVAEMTAAGVDCRHVRRVPGARTAFATVLIDPRGERVIVPFYDPALGAETGWLPLDVVDGCDAVLVDVRWPAGAAVVLDRARSRGLPAVLDADTAPAGVVEDLAPRASHIVFSEPAALAFSGAFDPAEAAVAIAGRLDGFVAVTAGARGCYWVDAEGRLRHAAPPPVAAIDTLAAGDVFHGAFTLRLAEGCTIGDCITFANAAAALKCSRFGGRLGAPDRDEVLALLSAPRLGTQAAG